MFVIFVDIVSFFLRCPKSIDIVVVVVRFDQEDNDPIITSIHKKQHFSYTAKCIL
jgi:hypothetical protein